MRRNISESRNLSNSQSPNHYQPKWHTLLWESGSHRKVFPQRTHDAYKSDVVAAVAALVVAIEQTTTAIMTITTTPATNTTTKNYC